jgi:hypothetical protein
MAAAVSAWAAQIKRLAEKETQAMKKALLATAGSALALILLAGATPAKADVNVVADIQKTKLITVHETIDITKVVDIVVSAIITPDAAAEAQALMNVSNHGAVVGGPRNSTTDQNTPATLDNRIPHVTDFHLRLSALMDGSGNGNTGVWGFNQDVGNMTNQGNVVSVAGITDLPSFADAQAEADQSDTNNTVTDIEIARVNGLELGNVTDATHVGINTVTGGAFDAEKTATIHDSVNKNSGVMNVNQNAGNMNNQTNGVAAAVGLQAQVAMSESALGQTNSGNKVFEVETVKRGLIDGSINGNTGIVNVNQSTGNMNNQGNVVSLAATVSGAILGN